MNKERISIAIKKTIEEKKNRLTSLKNESKVTTRQADFVDESSDNESRSVNITLINKLECDIIDIENTLLRVNTDRFGICISCEEEIPEKRIIAIPQAKECIDCLNLRG